VSVLDQENSLILAVQLAENQGGANLNKVIHGVFLLEIYNIHINQ